MNPSQLATLVAYAIQIAQLVFKIIGVIKGVNSVPTPAPVPSPVIPSVPVAGPESGGPGDGGGPESSGSVRRVRHDNLRVFDPDHGGEAG